MDPFIAMQESQYKNGPRSIFKKRFLNFLDSFNLSFVVFVFCIIVVPLWLHVSNSYFLLTISRVVAYYILNPKVLFIITNVIVIMLIRESRPSSYLPDNELDKEYIVRSHSCGSWSHENVRMQMEHQRFSKNIIDRPRLEESPRSKFSLRHMDPLNQRADDLIARVNRQRRLEIGLLQSRIDHI